LREQDPRKRISGQELRGRSSKSEHFHNIEVQPEETEPVSEEMTEGQTEQEKKQTREAAGRNRVLRYSQKSMRLRKKIGAAAAVLVVLLAGVGLWFFLQKGVAKSYPVRILDRGRELEVMTEDLTVSEVLSVAEIDLAASDIVTPDLDSVLPEEGAVISITRSITVTINAADGIHKAKGAPGMTVAQALAQAGLTVTELDSVTPELDTVLYSSSTVEFVQVTQKEKIIRISLDYKTETRESSDYYIGQSVVYQKGVAGILERTLLVTYRDGEEVSRAAIKEEVVQEPVDKIVLKGTKVRPTPTPRPTPKPTVKATSTKKTASATAKNSTSKTPSPTKAPDTSVKISPEDLTVPGPPDDYLETMSMEVTAYTHTGRKTATGTWPRWSRTRENPGTVAVAPQTIPYHTLMYITGYGYAISEDTGGFRYTKPMMLDVFMNTTKECINWGRRREVKVYIVAYDVKSP